VKLVPCRVLASGFRLAFLLAGIAAVLLIPAWVAILVYGAPFGSGWPPTLWHAHEMLFGFIAAAVAGFLLTAVPSWTGQRGFGGAPLVVLGALWLCARVLNATSAAWPAALVLVVDVAFLLALAALFAPPLLRERNRNTPMLLVLTLLAACNVAFHRALGRHDPPAASHALLMGIDIALLLVTIVGGRIIPAFTATALREAGSTQRVRTHPVFGHAAIAIMVAVGLVDLCWPGSRGAAVLAAIAALVQALRLLQWRSLATFAEPMVWVLHAAYAWLPLGLALKCVALQWGLAASAFWLHALTVGVLATMILGVMTRVALSHTGRPMQVGALTTAAYTLLLLAGLTRVFGLALPGIDYASVIVLSATFWSAAFALFLTVYGPMLWLPRIDGRSG
jgi:uncharacterized protein involved in response to NO